MYLCPSCNKQMTPVYRQQFGSRAPQAVGWECKPCIASGKLKFGMKPIPIADTEK